VKNDGEVNMQPWELMGNFSLQEHFHFVMKKKQESIAFNIHGSMHRKNILIYIQQDATLHSLFYLKTALHVSL
jgi:hypothetical protein